jgi:hypothetical protein
MKGMAQSAWRMAPDARDVFFFGGLGLLGFGLWQIWWPLPFIVCGGILVGVALSATFSEVKNGNSE